MKASYHIPMVISSVKIVVIYHPESEFSHGLIFTIYWVRCRFYLVGKACYQIRLTEKNLYVTNRSLLIWQNSVYSFISCEKCVVLGGLPLILVVTFKGLRTEFWPIWNGNWHMLISSSETFVIVSKLDQYQRSAGQLVGSGSHLWLGVIGGTHQRHQDCNQVFISEPVGHQ